MADRSGTKPKQAKECRKAPSRGLDPPYVIMLRPKSSALSWKRPEGSLEAAVTATEKKPLTRHFFQWAAVSTDGGRRIPAGTDRPPPSIRERNYGKRGPDFKVFKLALGH